jgi:ABC-type transport system involved in multi-copper enzyme maturation permease subunit
MLGPIFLREWLTTPRRPRHYLVRAFYFAALWVLLLTIWQTVVGWEATATLGDHARFGLLGFQILSYVQLTLLLFFSALSAASAISQEKDRRTFLLLLMTDLRNHEIVLGKLFGSLLQILLLLAGSVPIFALLMLLGGIEPTQILDAILVLATTALAAGSLGGLVALWREKTFQSLALTVLFLVLYFLLVHALPLLGMVQSGLDVDALSRVQYALEPFLVLQDVMRPDETQSAFRPALIFAAVMLGIAALLNLWGIWKLRVWNPSGEPIMQRENTGEEETTAEERAKAHAAPGLARGVWSNPVLWREIATRAYGRRPLMVKTAYFVVLGLVGYYALVLMPPRDWAAAYGLVPVAILSLLLISAQAVTSVTSERDIGALDLLMVTDLSGKEFVFGKLLGVCWNTKEYILPPLILTVIYAVRGQLGAAPRGYPDLIAGKNLESALCIGIATLVLMAFTMVLGLHVALRTYNSRLAAINTLGTVFFLSVGTLVCIYLILVNGRFEYQWLSFSGFIVAGVGGLWWVLNADRAVPALNVASWLCPLAVFYTVTNILIGKPGTGESTDPLIPLIVTGGAFGFTLVAMLIPLLSEFDVAIGRSSAIGE